MLLLQGDEAELQNQDQGVDFAPLVVGIQSLEWWGTWLKDKEPLGLQTG
jgi:hypothetical protein